MGVHHLGHGTGHCLLHLDVPVGDHVKARLQDRVGSGNVNVRDEAEAARPA
jgi:hypothetical protein